MIDEEKIQGKIDIIDRNLQQLQDFDTDRLDEFWDQQAVKYSLLEVTEACIDIANHIISAEGYRRPEDYGEYFNVLEEEDVIDSELAEQLEAMAGFRNILVHRYADIENERLATVIEERLDDVRDFVDAIDSFLTSG